MGPEDRAYFMHRAVQERDAAARASCPEARERHEEMASLYRMRIMYIDHGLFGPTEKSPEVRDKVENAAPDPEQLDLVRQSIPVG